MKAMLVVLLAAVLLACTPAAGESAAEVNAWAERRDAERAKAADALRTPEARRQAEEEARRSGPPIDYPYVNLDSRTAPIDFDCSVTHPPHPCYR